MYMYMCYNHDSQHAQTFWQNVSYINAHVRTCFVNAYVRVHVPQRHILVVFPLQE